MSYMSGYSERAVHKALRYAEHQGYIRVDKPGGGAGQATRYQVLLITHYFEAAAANKAWQNPARGARITINKNPARGSENPAPRVKNPAPGAPDPNLIRSEPIKSAVKTAKETKAYLERVFAEN
jgi:hypothetical protein